MFHSYIREWFYWCHWECVCWFGRVISVACLIVPPFRVQPWWVWVGLAVAFHLLLRQVHFRLADIRPFAVRELFRQRQLRRWGVIP